MNQTEETDGKSTGLQKITDRAYSMLCSFDDLMKTEVPMPSLFERYREKHNNQYNYYKEMFTRYFERVEICEYLAGIDFTRKCIGLLPYSKENAKQRAAQKILSDMSNGTVLTQSVLEKLPDGSGNKK